MKRPNLGMPVPRKIGKVGASTEVAKSAGVKNIKSEAPVASKGGKTAGVGAGIKGGKSGAVASAKSGAKAGVNVGSKGGKVGAVAGAKAKAGVQGDKVGAVAGAKAAMKGEKAGKAEATAKKEAKKAAKEQAKEDVEGEGVPHFPYVVRGARIFCPFGTHIRRLDMPYAHGAFIRDKPMLNEDDCKVGLDYNIAPFGGCHSELNDGKRVDITVGEDEEPMPNARCEETEELIFPEPGTVIKDVKLCKPRLMDKWLDAEKETLVDGKPALTMKCSIMCEYICTDVDEDAEYEYEVTGISFIDDGQEVGQ